MPIRAAMTERQAMFRYGDKVVIRDGTGLDGAVGIVFRVNPEGIHVLLDREVFWVVAAHQLEHCASGGPAVAGRDGKEW